jgi:hypothetical protein
MVFVGRRFFDEKYVWGPLCEFDWPNEEKTLAGLEAACELSWEKLRADEVAKAAASGDVLDVAWSREFLNNPEPVKAVSRVRDAMVSFGASDVMTRRGARSSSAIGKQLQERPTLHDIITPHLRQPQTNSRHTTFTTIHHQILIKQTRSQYLSVCVQSDATRAYVDFYGYFHPTCLLRPCRFRGQTVREM